MNNMGLSKTAWKIFWASLFTYCLAFSGFYFTTQYTLKKLVTEEQQGKFLGFKEALCKGGTACSDVSYKNSMNIALKQYQTIVNINAKQIINEQVLQNHYADFMATLPWYVRMQFSQDLVISKVNGKPFMGNVYE
jgi:hypothetical protein